MEEHKRKLLNIGRIGSKMSWKLGKGTAVPIGNFDKQPISSCFVVDVSIGVYTYTQYTFATGV